jgi:hypothetical protein
MNTNIRLLSHLCYISGDRREHHPKIGFFCSPSCHLLPNTPESWQGLERTFDAFDTFDNPLVPLPLNDFMLDDIPYYGYNVHK